MHPILKEPGVVHTWYNIPLFTIFSQQSNCDVFRTKLCDSKSSTQSITNFKGGSFSYFSLPIPLWLPEDHSRTPATWPCRSWVVNSHQDYSKGNSQVLRIPWTTQLVHTGSNQESCIALAHLGQFIFNCGNSVTQFNS
ncbi:hypothetical protein O181_049851 [Austropuccinia psidii MF-1]|uniref:Uncharacterized protein n=1 Tax=Austropuccinia psidii MF-1 TaxID=1389203 RepID=A0A9Q3DT63_9BASI|nr:hypothetical protein [Austropuccinia psidii MF-1]